jgi:adenosylcobinamide kinase / adenosylcobinamide-phosphate guanylyltransferase
MTRTLVFGGARSGKSAHAESLAAASGREVVYIATADAGDAEMQARIARHRERRDPQWTTVEARLALGHAIAEWSAPHRLVLVDCLTVWLSNLLFSQPATYPDVGRIEPPPAFATERASLLDAIEHAAGDIVLVSNEVGMGIVPQGAVSRWFVDEAGRLNQAVAARCDRVAWVAAGLPLMLKGGPC